MFVLSDKIRLHYRKKTFVFSLVVTFLIWAQYGHGDDLFRDQIAPILQKKCVACHNDNDLDGGLSLQTSESFFKGGENGEIVTRGKPNESALIDYVSGDEPEMPKDADPLSKKEIDSIRKWIEQGAGWPNQFQIAYETGISRDWWSLKNPIRPNLPETKSNPIDFFVGKQHASKGLAFAEQADRRVLIRRLYSDLIGLPPTIEEVNQFVNSRDPRAYEKLVDSLLASPRYGERWARHWLDVVQYGETHGYDKDKPRMNAWPYRDYVIRSFNQDKPYAQFVKEQLAGDALYPDSADGIVATGFISAGPWDFIGHAEVPESKIDGQVARNLDRDNMVTSTMNTFCSLTVQCARCHNHKLDPVTMEEYYNLQAVFAAIDRADRDYDVEPDVARRRAELTAEKRMLENNLSRINQAIADRKTPELLNLEKRVDELKTRISESVFPKPTTPKSRRMGYHSQVAKKQNTRKWVQIDLGKVTSIDAVAIVGAVEYGFDDFGFPHQFIVESSLTKDFKETEVLLDQTATDFPRPGTMPVIVKTMKPIKGRFVRLTGTKLWNRRVKGQAKTDDWIFAIGEMAVITGSRVADAVDVTSLDSIEAFPGWSRQNLVDHLFGGHDLETKLGRKESPSNGYHSLFADKADSTKWIQLNFDKPQKLDELRIYPAFPTDFKDTPGFGFPIRFRIELSSDPDFKSPTIVRDQTAKDFANPLLKPLVVDLASNKPFQHIRLTATKLWDRGDKGGRNHALALSEIELFAIGENIAPIATVTASDSIDSGRWHSRFINDGFTSRLPLTKRIGYLTSAVRDPNVAEELSNLQGELSVLTKSLAGDLLKEKSQTLAELASVEANNKKLPKPSRVYAGTVHQGGGAFRGRAGLGPREIFVLHRGDVTRKKQKAVPGTVPFVDGTNSIFELDAGHHESARRVALANWIVRKDNPLTWRSIVNRVWQYHFGIGIVDTPNDFGRGGGLPTHPELLDWLAIEFRDGGKYVKQQSIKSLHRLICNSRTYKQVSTTNRFTKQDSGNRFLWRMNRRRMSAEEIHDSVLKVSGILNLKMGGPSYQDFVIQRPEHSPHYEYHLYDPLDPKTHRRAVYRFIVRSQPQPFMDTLDCADPSFSVPQRSETLTALQALGMLNNQFMVAMAEKFADRLRKESNELPEQIRRGYQSLIGRLPQDDELKLLEKYAKEHGLANLCRVLFNLNEFVFVD